MRVVRSDVIRALNSALLAASPQSILRHKVKVFGEMLQVGSLKLNLSSYDRTIIIGAGKASAWMAAEIEKLLGSRITAGVVNVPDYLKRRPRLKRIALHSATHPIPSESGVKGMQMMLNIVGKPSNRDLIVCLISGGGSALMPMPQAGLKLSDDQMITNLLLKSGAQIDEINIVRKHLSAVKGGRLAEMLYPARVLTLIISDVVGDKIDAIASGPTVPDSTTYEDTKNVLLRFGLWKKIPNRVRDIIEKGVSDRSRETPKAGSEIFARVSNLIVGTNKQSCDSAAKYLRSLGYRTNVLSTHVQGEAKEIGKFYSGLLRDMHENALPSAIIAGGETTVTITEAAGRGGRNQELVLSCAIGIDGLDGAVVASMGTDGVDGPTDAAGAIADDSSIRRAMEKGVDAASFLQTHNSYHFFNKLGDLIRTGPTGTNVNDITILAMK